MKIPLKTQNARGDPELHPITQADVDQWANSYPTVDVPAELKALRQWNIDNPQKRKTKAGIRRHISAWLLRARDGPAQEDDPQSLMSDTQRHNLRVARAFLAEGHTDPFADVDDAITVRPEPVDPGAVLRKIAGDGSRDPP